MSRPSAQYEQARAKGGAKMGADAVVVVYDQMQVLGAPPFPALVVGAPRPAPIVGRVVVGLAIRYSGP